MENHIKNIIEIINYIADQVYRLEDKNIIKETYKKLYEIIEEKAIYCEISNLIYFWKIKKEKNIDDCFKELFKNRDPMLELIVRSELEKLKEEVKDENLEIIVEKKKKMEMDKLKDYCFINILLSWLGGPLKNKISNKLKDFIGYTSTLINYLNNEIYLDYITQIEINNLFEEKDTKVIENHKIYFLINIYEALNKLKDDLKNYPNEIDQIMFIDKYLKKLETEVNNLDDLFNYFSDKIIVLTSLIYLTWYPIEIRLNELDKFEKILSNLITRYLRYLEKEINIK
ncbi:MAG: hypothetical protein QXM27_00955 [Candidatus Pacearchaeota archaeon]